MSRRTEDLTTFNTVAFAVLAIIIAEGGKRLFPTAMPVMLAFCALATLIAIKICWPLRGRRWFVPFFLLAVLAQIPIAAALGGLGINGSFLLMTPVVGLIVFLIVWAALRIDDLIS